MKDGRPMDSIEQFQLDEQFMREALAEARAAAAEGEDYVLSYRERGT